MDEEDNKYLKEKVIKGMVLLIAREVLLRIFSISGQIVLVRLIAPQYFGIFAILIFVASFFELFSDLGFTQAIIQQKEKVKENQLGAIILVRLSLGLVAATLLIVSFPLIRIIYPQLSSQNFAMVCVLALTILPKTVKEIIFALFDKELNFKAVSRVDILGVIIYYAIALLLASRGLYLWSLIIAILLKEISELFLSLYYLRTKIRLSIDFRSIGKMTRYGSYLQIGSFIAFAEQSIVPIAGRSLSAYQLGLLQWGEGVSDLSNAFFDNYGRVAFAGMSKIQREKEKLTNAVNKSISLLNTIAFLFCILLLGFAGEFIVLFLPRVWLPSLPALYWFVASLFFYGASLTIAHALLAIGKSKEVTFFTGIVGIGEIISALLLVNYIGFVGIAIAVFLSNLTQFVGYRFLASFNSIKIEEWNAYLSKLLIAAVSGIIIFMMNTIFHEAFILTFVIKLSTTTLFYICMLYLVSKNDIYELKNIIRLFLNRKT